MRKLCTAVQQQKESTFCECIVSSAPWTAVSGGSLICEQSLSMELVCFQMTPPLYGSSLGLQVSPHRLSILHLGMVILTLFGKETLGSSMFCMGLWSFWLGLSCRVPAEIWGGGSCTDAEDLWIPWNTSTGSVRRGRKRLWVFGLDILSAPWRNNEVAITSNWVTFLLSRI